MRIMLANGGASTRFALCKLLEQQPGWRVVGEVSSVVPLEDRIGKFSPDILLLDWNLPGLNILETVPLLKKNFPEMAVIVLSGRPELKTQACTAGADAFVSKTESPDRLLGAISAISEQMK